MRRRTGMILIGVALMILGLASGTLFAPEGATSAAGVSAYPLLPSPTATATSTPSATAKLPAVATPSATPEPQMDGFVTRTYVASSGATMTYYLHIPSGYLPTSSYPLVLLLHGTGEAAIRGDTPKQNAAVLLSNSYVNIWSGSSIQSRWPSFILVPQVVTPARWSSATPRKGSFTIQPQAQPALQMTMAILATVVAQYAVDPQRIYLTGLSMGGYGAWEAAERWPSVFAAVVPIAGAGDPKQAAGLTKVPVWVFQSAHDTVVPISGSLDMIKAIKAAGGQPCFTEFSGSSHDTSTWMAVYTNSVLLKWLFAQGTSKATAAGMQHCAA